MATQSNEMKATPLLSPRQDLSPPPTAPAIAINKFCHAFSSTSSIRCTTSFPSDPIFYSTREASAGATSNSTTHIVAPERPRELCKIEPI